MLRHDLQTIPAIICYRQPFVDEAIDAIKYSIKVKVYVPIWTPVTALVSLLESES